MIYLTIMLISLFNVVSLIIANNDLKHIPSVIGSTKDKITAPMLLSVVVIFLAGWAMVNVTEVLIQNEVLQAQLDEGN